MKIQTAALFGVCPFLLFSQGIQFNHLPKVGLLLDGVSPRRLATRRSHANLRGSIAHQLRVHLQFLGHPIANDPVYSEKRIWASGCRNLSTQIGN